MTKKDFYAHICSTSEFAPHIQYLAVLFHELVYDFLSNPRYFLDVISELNCVLMETERDVNSMELIDLFVHFGGKIVWEPRAHYEGGSMVRRAVDMEKLSTFEFKYLHDEVGGKGNVSGIYYSSHGKSIANGVSRIKSDADLREFLNAHNGLSHAKIYLKADEPLNLNELNVDETLQIVGNMSLNEHVCEFDDILDKYFAGDKSV